MRVLELKITVEELPGENLSDVDVDNVDDVLHDIDWGALAKQKLDDELPELAGRVRVVVED